MDERDVSLHGEYLRELRGLAGAGDAPPRLFVMGRYLGGVDAYAKLAESGKLREMMRWARARGEACAARTAAAARAAAARGSSVLGVRRQLQGGRRRRHRRRRRRRAVRQVQRERPHAVPHLPLIVLHRRESF